MRGVGRQRRGGAAAARVVCEGGGSCAEAVARERRSLYGARSLCYGLRDGGILRLPGGAPQEVHLPAAAAEGVVVALSEEPAEEERLAAAMAPLRGRWDVYFGDAAERVRRPRRGGCRRR